ncbi:MAG: TlpA family protein disulfide reductase [Longispora sp.]|nr:TlpA family protein disulfide reductase [Longispora sp. (in: high G+C Gram-positive bacteria)]
MLALVTALLGGCAARQRPPIAEEAWFEKCAPSDGVTAKGVIELPCFTGGANATVTGPAVVNLWASWCGPCRQELPAFQRLADSGKVAVLGVVTLDDRARALDTAKDLDVRFANFYDPDGRVQKSTGKALLPITLFIDENGKIAHSYTGAPLDDATLGILVEEYVS